VKNKTLREFIERTLGRDAYDLDSHNTIELPNGTFLQERLDRHPDSLYYYFWPALNISYGRINNLIKGFHGAAGYRCIVLARDMYAFQKPDEPLRLISVNREKLARDELILICESEILQGDKNDKRTI
jgi:hypothetical protein